MRIRIVILTVTLAAILVGALPVLAAADITAALDYLQTQQNADGGFGSGFSPDSTLGSTADVVLAIVAAGGDLATFDQDGNTPLTYLEANASSATSGGDLSKLILAAIAAGENPRDLGGVDSVAKLESLFDAGGRIGGEADTFVSHVLAVLALASAQRPIPAAAVDYIKDAQQENGSWAWDGTAETAGDTNTTAFAVQALVAAGETPAATRSPTPWPTTRASRTRMAAGPTRVPPTLAPPPTRTRLRSPSRPSSPPVRTRRARTGPRPARARPSLPWKPCRTRVAPLPGRQPCPTTTCWPQSRPCRPWQARHSPLPPWTLVRLPPPPPCPRQVEGQSRWPFPCC